MNNLCLMQITNTMKTNAKSQSTKKTKIRIELEEMLRPLLLKAKAKRDLKTRTKRIELLKMTRDFLGDPISDETINNGLCDLDELCSEAYNRLVLVEKRLFPWAKRRSYPFL